MQQKTNLNCLKWVLNFVWSFIQAPIFWPKENFTNCINKFWKKLFNIQNCWKFKFITHHFPFVKQLYCSETKIESTENLFFWLNSCSCVWYRCSGNNASVLSNINNNQPNISLMISHLLTAKEMISLLTRALFWHRLYDVIGRKNSGCVPKCFLWYIFLIYI